LYLQEYQCRLCGEKIQEKRRSLDFDLMELAHHCKNGLYGRAVLLRRIYKGKDVSVEFLKRIRDNG